NFSFGGDIMTWPDARVRELRARFGHYMSVFNRFEHLPVPVVAAVQGLCFGGGLELALRADVIFAGASATFGHPEQTLGIVTVLGGIYRVAERVGRSRVRMGHDLRKGPGCDDGALRRCQSRCCRRGSAERGSRLRTESRAGAHPCLRCSQGAA